jgi:hypothetical protein
MEGYDLTAKKGLNAKHLAYLLHQKKELCPIVIEHFGLNTLIATKNNGIVSNLLVHFIEMNDIENILEILNKTEDILMKRDYLHVIKYYYDKVDTIELACDIFSSKIDKMSLLPKDIDYILENKMFMLLPKLEGLFITTSYSEELVILPENNMVYLDDINIMKIKQEIQEEIKVDIPINKNIKVIIDGGSIVHARNGKINHHSMNDIIHVIDTARHMIGEPMLVIHSRHIKTLPQLIEKLKQHNVRYQFTPPKVNDDLFILDFFLKLETKAYIITNDKYRDHIFNFNKPQFRNIIEQQTLNYNIYNNIINIMMKPKYSKCIQIIDDNIYIPYHDMDLFVIIK